MQDEKLYETEEMNKKRADVLEKIENIVKEWVVEETKLHAKGDYVTEASVAKLYTFGSYQLGVHSPGSDIDALCVAPMHITRSSFFDKLL